MEPPSFPAGPSGGRTLRAAPGGEATFLLPLPAGTPPFSFEWSRAGVRLGDRFTTTDDAGGVRLTVSAAKVGDSGVYTLQASNAAGKDTTRVRLEVSPEEMPTGEDPPNFLRRLQDLTVKVGTRTRFLVEIISSTECRVTWYRNERRLLEAERIALVRDGNFWCADISAISVDDAGRWTCTAENVGGRASCSAHLNVLVPKAYKRPEFVEELRALLTEQGTVSLECKVVGVPTPVLRWFKDSCEIKAGDVFALTANAEDPTSLGTYTCEAVNCMGRAYSSSKVHVVGRASRETSARPSSGGALLDPPPIFTKEIEDQFVRICEPLTISCNIVVPPWPRSVIWYNKEGKIEASEKYHVLEDGVGGYLLEVPSAEWPDEGEWKCVATSVGGRVGISTCYVSMDVPKNYRKPRFMENLQAVLTEEGLVSFECKVVGFPTPVLSWFKDGQELKPGDVYQLTGTNSLGSYCCIARNCMGQASSSAELTVEDIQNQLNEEEKLQLFSKNQAPKFLQGLKSVEAKIDEPFRFTIKVAIPPEPAVVWYRDDQPVDESSRCHHGKEERGVSFLDIQNLEFMDQAEWKCVAMNDYGHSVTSCFLKLIIPRHYKKPRFLENLQAILSDEGAVNLECKVIGVPQPVLKWYKDGEELKPGDIHRIISGQDGTCCLGTYTCEAQNCMGIASSSASLLGFEDSMKSKNKKKTDEQALQRNLSLSTIHEERTSQMYDTPVGDITLDERGEISFSFDGKEVSVSLYETPDLTEEEALQIVEMYADQLSENVTEHNVVELPPLRFVKETSTSGNLLMEAIIIDVSPEYFTSPEEDLRTEADIEDISIADENGPPQLSLDPETDGEDYLEKTIALMSEEKADFSKIFTRKKSDSQKSAEDYYSLSRDQSISDEKKDDDTQPLSESELQSFASARSSGKPKSKSSKPSIDDGQESSDMTKTVLLREELQNQPVESDSIIKNQQRRRSRSSRKSSSGSEQSLNKFKNNILEVKVDSKEKQETMEWNKIKSDMTNINSTLTKITNEIQLIERDIILKSELMASAATATKSLEIINSLLTPLSEIHSITDAVEDIISEPSENIVALLNRLPQTLEILLKSLTIVCKCTDVENENKTLVKKTSISIIEKCGSDLHYLITEIADVSKQYHDYENVCSSMIENVALELINIINHSIDIINNDQYKIAEMDSNISEISEEVKHVRDTQKGIYELRSSLKSLLCIVNNVDFFESARFNKIKKCEIILNDMSIPIQDLQSALEYIETLSITESKSTFPKYNTEIIENIMESIIQLRASFKNLSAETDKNEDENDSNQILIDIKFNINNISLYLNDLEAKTGKFDILYNDNKFDVLQKMAQILIALENNLPLLENIPDIKLHLSEFHKNLTKILENVIESDDSKKYFNLLDICDGINRINSSLKSIDSNTELSLANVCNTLKIIKDNIDKNVFPQYLNQSISSNIKSVLLSIESLYNIPEEISLNSDIEIVQDLSTRENDEKIAKIALEHIDQTIAVISSISPHDTVKDLIVIQTFNNICPILEDMKYNIGNIIQEAVKDEKTSDLDSLSYTETIAHQLCDLHKTINVLNQALYECTSDQESSKIIGEYAKPLLELNTTLQILQQDIISQCKENTTYSNIDSDVANVLESLKSCIILVQEPQCIEALDDMSTLEDISAIKSVAEIVPCETLARATVEETKYFQFSEIFLQSLTTTSAQTLHLLNHQIALLQNREFLEDLKSLPSINDNNNVIFILCQLEAVISSTQVILESTQDIPSWFSSTVYKNMVHSLQEAAENLSIEISKVNILENVTDSSTKQKQVLDKLVEFKNNLNDSLTILRPSMELADFMIDISKNIANLRSLSENLSKILNSVIMSCSDVPRNNYLTNLKYTVTEFLESTNCPCEIKLPRIKKVIQNLYVAVIIGQDELISFTAPSEELLAETAIVDITCNIKNIITSLVQHHFVDVSEDLDNPCSNLPINTGYINTKSITQVKVDIEDVLEMVQLQDERMTLVNEFCEIFKNEITLLQYLIEDPSSLKRVIKLFQVFYSVRNRLQDFKHVHQNLILSKNVDKCLIKLFDDSEESFKHVQLLLTEIIESYSDILFDIPIGNINNIEANILTVLKSSDETHFHQLIDKFVNIVLTLRPCFENLKSSVIKELYLNPIKDREIPINEKEDNYELETFYTLVLNGLENVKTNEQEKYFYESILDIIRQHKDYKDAVGSGKQIILIKCLSDCSKILKEKLENMMKHASHEESSTINLVTINQFMENLSIKLQTIYEQRSLEIDKDDLTLGIKPADIELTIKIIEKLEQFSSNKNLCLDNNDLYIVIEIDRKIQTIKNILNSAQDKSSFENIDVLQKSIEEINKILQKILSSENITPLEKIKVLKEKTQTFVQHMEHYIEVIEIVEEISAIIKIDELRESTNIAKELLQNIEATEKANNSISNNVTEEQDHKVKLAQKLQKALTSFQAQVFENQQEFAPIIDEEVRQKITKVVFDLQSDLVALTGTNIYLIEDENKLSDTVVSHRDPEVEEKLTVNPNNEIEESKSIQSKVTTSRLQEGQYYAENNEVDKKGNLTTLSKELKIEEASQGEDILTLSGQAPDSSLQDSLKESIKEYVSDNTKAIIYKFSPLIRIEHINHTVKVAEQLLNYTFFEESSPQKDISTFTVEQYELVLSLYESLSIMSETIFEQTRDTEDVVAKYEMDFVKNIVNNLRATLQLYITSSRNALQLEMRLDEQVSLATEEENKHQKMQTGNTLTYEENILSEAQIIQNYESSLPAGESLNVCEVGTFVKQLEEYSNEKEKSIVLPEEIIENLTAFTTKKEPFIFNKTSSSETDISISVSVENEKYKLNQEILVNQLKEYIRDDILQSIQKVPLISENLYKSIEMARQLQTVTITEGLEAPNLSKTQLSLALKLEYTMLPICDLICNTSELNTFFELEEVKKSQSIAKNLQKSLKTLITSTLSQIDEQILELDEFKVIIEKDPFDYEILIKEKQSEVLPIEALERIGNVNKEDFPLAENANTLTESIKSDTDNEILLVDEPKLKEKLNIIAPGDDVTIKDDVMISWNEDLNIIRSDLPPIDEENLDSLSKLSKLFQNANESINLSSEMLSIDESESLQNTLDEVQIVIMELKYDCDGAIKETFNEIVEDLECNVRSVQIQIKEHSPSCQLKEACVTLQTILTHLCEISELDNIKISATSTLDDCSSEAGQSIELLEKATSIKGGKKLENIISNLNNIKETMKLLRLSFVSEAETLILGGIEIMQNIDNIEEKIFCLERDMENEMDIDPLIKDSIMTAVHSVYGNISNMRGTVTSIQKKYLYKNYGLPSRNFLHSIKNTKTITKYDNQSYWKDCATVFRKVLNHFEDIKFYINFDKTARLPSDAAFTKIILNELSAVVSGVNQLHISHLDKNVCIVVQNCLNCVNQLLSDIEQKTTLEVKDKIPMFKTLSTNVLDFTSFLMYIIEKEATQVVVSEIKHENKLVDVVEQINIAKIDDFALKDNKITTYENNALADDDDVTKDRVKLQKEQNLKEENDIKIDEKILEENQSILSGKEFKIVDATEFLEASYIKNEEVSLIIENVEENVKSTLEEETILNKQDKTIDLYSVQIAEMTEEKQMSLQLEQNKLQNKEYPLENEEAKVKMLDEDNLEKNIIKRDENTKIIEGHQERLAQVENIDEKKVDICQIIDQQKSLQEKRPIEKYKNSELSEENQQESAKIQKETEIGSDYIEIQVEKKGEAKSIYKGDISISEIKEQQKDSIEERCTKKDKENKDERHQQQKPALDEKSVKDEGIRVIKDDQQQQTKVKESREKKNEVMKHDQQKSTQEETLIAKEAANKVKGEDQQQLEPTIERNKIDIIQIIEQNKSSQNETSDLPQKDNIANEKEGQTTDEIQKIYEKDSDKIRIQSQRQEEKSISNDVSIIELEEKLKSSKEETSVKNDEGSILNTQNEQKSIQDEISVKKEETIRIKEDEQQPIQIENLAENKVDIGLIFDQQNSPQDEISFVRDNSSEEQEKDQEELAQIKETTEIDSSNDILSKSEIQQQKCAKELNQQKSAEVQKTSVMVSDNVKIKAEQSEAHKQISKDNVSNIDEGNKLKSPKDEIYIEKGEDNILNTQDEQKYSLDKTLIMRDEKSKVDNENQELLEQVENIAKNKVNTVQIANEQESPQNETYFVKEKDFDDKEKNLQQLVQFQKATEMDNGKVKYQNDQTGDKKSISKDDISIIQINEQLENTEVAICIKKDEENKAETQKEQKQDETAVTKNEGTRQNAQVKESTEKDQQKCTQEKTPNVKVAETNVKEEDQQQFAQLEIIDEKNKADIVKVPEQHSFSQDDTSVVKGRDTTINEEDQQKPADLQKTSEKNSDNNRIQDQQQQDEKSLSKDEVSIIEIEEELKFRKEEIEIKKDEDTILNTQDEEKSTQDELSLIKDENYKIQDEAEKQPLLVEQATQRQKVVIKQEQLKSLQEGPSILKDYETKVKTEETHEEITSNENYDKKNWLEDEEKHTQEEKLITANENEKVEIDHQQLSVEKNQQSAQEEKPSLKDRERIVKAQEIPIIKDDDTKIITEVQQQAKVEKSNEKQSNEIVNEDMELNLTDQDQCNSLKLFKNEDEKTEIIKQGQHEAPPEEKMRDKDEDSKIKTLSQMTQENIKIEDQQQCLELEKSTEKGKKSKVKLQDQQTPSQEEQFILKDKDDKDKKKDQQQSINREKLSIDENNKIETQKHQKLTLEEKSVEKERETDIQVCQNPLQTEKSTGKTVIEEVDVSKININNEHKQLIETDVDIKTSQKTSTEKGEDSKFKVQELEISMNNEKLFMNDECDIIKIHNEQKSLKEKKIVQTDEADKTETLISKEISQDEKTIEKDADDKLVKEIQQQPSCELKPFIVKDSNSKQQPQEGKLTEQESSKMKIEEQQKPECDDKSVETADKSKLETQDKEISIHPQKIINSNHNLDEQKLLQESIEKLQEEKLVEKDNELLSEHKLEQEAKLKDEDGGIRTKILGQENLFKIEKPQDEESQKEISQVEQSIKNDKDDIFEIEDQQKCSSKEKSTKKDSISKLKSQQKKTDEKQLSKKDKSSKIKHQEQQKSNLDEKSEENIYDSNRKLQDEHKHIQIESSDAKGQDNKNKIQDQQNHSHEKKTVNTDIENKNQTQHQFILEQNEKPNKNDFDHRDNISNQQIPTKIEKSIFKDVSGKPEDQLQQKPMPDKVVEIADDRTLKIEDQKRLMQLEEVVKKEESDKIQDKHMQLGEISLKKEERSDSKKSIVKLISKDTFNKDEKIDARNQEEGTNKLESQINDNKILYEKQIQKHGSDENLKTENYIEEVPEVKKHKKKSSNKSQQPVFMKVTKPDYDLEFSRPPSYISKTNEGVDEIVPITKINNKIPTIYKAQTLLFESQLRSSLPPHQRSSEEKTQMKDTMKAVSETRSTLSEKRTGISRDVRRKPVFSTHLTDRTAVESSRVKLTCSILSTTGATITWYKNGVLLDNKQKFRSKYVEGLITLEVLNAVPSDSGEYSCTVQNEYGAITSSANLKVYPSFEASPIPPTFTRSIRDIYHVAENELVLECRIRGQPLPTITWLKNDKPISLNEHIQAHYLADGVCRLTINSPTSDDSGKYTCKAENSVWSDRISHEVFFTGKESQVNKNVITLEKIHLSRQAIESRRPHFTNVLSDHRVVSGGTIGLQVEIRGDPTRVEWLREGHSITEIYRNAQTYVDHDIYTLALTDVTERESGMYTCRAWSSHGNVDMNASITVVQANLIEGKPATIVSRPNKDLLISVGEDLNISFRVHGEPKPKVFLMKGMRDLTNSLRVCKMTSDDYVKFTLKRSVISDAGTYCIFARNSYGCDRAFVTVVIRQRASSDSLISDWTYPMDDLAISSVDRNYKCVPDRIPCEPSAVDGGNNWVTLAWAKPDGQVKAPILAYKIESWLLGKEGGARWMELGITPRNSFDAFNLKQGEEYHFRVTPRNRYGWGESVQTSVPIGIGLAGDRPEFTDILPGQLKVLLGENAVLSCSFKGKPTPEIVWMKNGHEIEEENVRVIINVDNLSTCLRINKVEIEDEGRYSCEATNIHGRSSTYARMAVITDRQIWEADAKLKRERSAGIDGEYPPQFTMRLRDRRVQATYPVRLTCQIVGNPPPTLTWFKNGEEILVNGRRVVSQDEYFHTLEIAPTTLEDGGVYEAMARNCYGAVSCRCSLVVDKGIRAYIAPEFCCGLEPLYHLNEGDELRISAVVEAYPSVGVTWYRDGVRLRPSRRAIMTLDRDGQIELALASVTRRDAGVYTCTASNEVGRASTSGKVEVVSGDKIEEKITAPPIVISPDVPYSKEPMFIRKPRSSEAHEGDTVIIECEVIGDPKPDVYWLRDFLKPDYYRDASHFKRVGAGPAYRFEIPHAKFDYTGAYSIIAKNIHGEAKAIISLQILAKDPNAGEDAHNVRFGRVEVIPHICKELTDLLCYDGDAVEFECLVSGSPGPDIRWLHYNEIVPDGPDFETSYDLGTARLKIKQVTADDEGTYSCEASNSLGKATSSACLVVYPPGEPNTLSQRLRRPPTLLSAASTPRSTPRTTPARSMSRTPGPDLRRLGSPTREVAPKFYTYPYNKVAEEGDTIVFQCAVRGQPPPWATWDKDGIIITPSARFSIKEKDETFKILEIEQVTIEDVGVYRITLENDYGRAEASARLEVITQKGKFYGTTRSYGVSPNKSLPYRRRTPSFSKQD